MVDTAILSFVIYGCIGEAMPFYPNH